MAIVMSVSRGVYVLLPPVARVGRHPTSDVALVHPMASGHHAEIRSRDGGWDLRDANSRNGTWLDGNRIMPGVPHPLERGAVMRFGERAEEWRVVDLEPPQPCLFQAETGQQINLIDGEVPERLVYDIEIDGWCLDGAPANDGDLVDGWCLHLPKEEHFSTTRPAKMDLDYARLAVLASRDLSRIDLRIDGVSSQVWIRDKAWAIAVYVLASARCEADGWVAMSRLVKLCGLDRKVLDIYLARARRAFSAAGIANGHQFIEVRRNARRLGLASVTVESIDE